MKKIAVNTCYGGFSLSDEAINLYLELSGKKNDPDFYDRDIPRDDKYLIQVIELLKEKANGPHSRLDIREIPKDVDYYISDYDGMESIHENHRSW